MPKIFEDSEPVMIRKAFLANIIRLAFVAFICSMIFTLSSCAKAPPRNRQDICSIFREYPSWYWDARGVREHWDLPISVLMAIIYQESRFQAHAAPPREKLLWIIPWKRPTSAYGYSQAVEGTWKHYVRDTGQSHWWTSRTAFGDAADFIGWLTHRAHKIAGISMNNAYEQYLAYHEGIGGYQRRSYLKKKWLMAVARKVQRHARMYRSQLLRCESSLPTKPWWHLW
jgi:hypothetical protein